MEAPADRVPVPGDGGRGPSRARCFALGVRSEAASAVLLCRRGDRRRGCGDIHSRRLFVMRRIWGRAARNGRGWVSPGDGRARTADPLLAKQVLSQLSYIPVLVGRVMAETRLDQSAPRRGRGPFWIRTRDLTVISRALSPTELKAPAGRATRRARRAGAASPRGRSRQGAVSLDP
jgi:hypothetical protein